MSQHLLCFGYGFSARHLAPALIADGWTVSATTRAADRDPVDGVRFISFDEVSAADIAGASHLLVSAPPSEEGDPILLRYLELIIASPGIEWIGYLSTTGVYGNTDGAWVDETSSLNPSSPRSTYRIEAENAWLDLHRNHQSPVHVFRLAGIYGAGRSALDQVRAGRAQRVDKPGHKFSRIHAGDIAKVLEASIGRPHPGGVYNVCDDEPAPQAEVIAYACDLLGEPVLPLVPFDKAAETMSPMARSFWKDNRLVDNSRIKDELGVALAYPSYREGLEAVFSSEND